MRARGGGGAAIVGGFRLRTPNRRGGRCVQGGGPIRRRWMDSSEDPKEAGVADAEPVGRITAKRRRGERCVQRGEMRRQWLDSFVGPQRGGVVGVMRPKGGDAAQVGRFN